MPFQPFTSNMHEDTRNHRDLYRKWTDSGAFLRVARQADLDHLLHGLVLWIGVAWQVRYAPPAIANPRGSTEDDSHVHYAQWLSRLQLGNHDCPNS